ncbi:MAG: serine/threonine protein phosphatase [Anaerolineae bacterium]|nr:serine/threonine protein phosphatase [Anaerolineae bacterium]
MATFIIGDIHGCYDELCELLDKAALTSDDRIIALGDLYNRGPDPRGVYHWLRDTPQASSLMGNHEYYHLQTADGDIQASPTILLARWLLDEDYHAAVEHMRTLPLSIELDEAVLVHGFYEPEVQLSHQRPGMLLGLDEKEEELKDWFDRPWYELYDGEKPLIVGHRDYTGEQKVFIRKGRVYGLDTRCVYGGSLTGLMLPEWRFVSVPSRIKYWSMLRKRHGFT